MNLAVNIFRKVQKGVQMSPYLKVLENIRGNKRNVLIFHEKEKYLVVLRRGNGYLLPWTAYLVEDKDRRKIFDFSNRKGTKFWCVVPYLVPLFCNHLIISISCGDKAGFEPIQLYGY